MTYSDSGPKAPAFGGGVRSQESLVGEWLADGDVLREKIIDGCARRSRFNSTFGRRGSTGRVHLDRSGVSSGVIGADSSSRCADVRNGFVESPSTTGSPRRSAESGNQSRSVGLTCGATTTGVGPGRIAGRDGLHALATTRAMAAGTKKRPPSQVRSTRSGTSAAERITRKADGVRRSVQLAQAIRVAMTSQSAPTSAAPAMVRNTLAATVKMPAIQSAVAEAVRGAVIATA